MYTFLLVLLIIDSGVLIAAILLQSGKGGGVAASFGGVSSSTDAFIGTRQAGNLLTTVSWWAGGIFLSLSFILQLMSTHARQPASVLDKTFGRPAPTAPAPAQSAPAVPLQPTQPAQPAPPPKK
ncbi:MAG TPA: preprotein translocase subunit SecG [Gemmatimonadaceae bacterium]|nr:preprotein translocase subunit SecG [Gemmatimonadaceae bacterium]